MPTVEDSGAQLWGKVMVAFISKVRAAEDEIEFRKVGLLHFVPGKRSLV